MSTDCKSALAIEIEARITNPRQLWKFKHGLQIRASYGNSSTDYKSALAIEIQARITNPR